MTTRIMTDSLEILKGTLNTSATNETIIDPIINMSAPTEGPPESASLSGAQSDEKRKSSGEKWFAKKVDNPLDVIKITRHTVKMIRNIPKNVTAVLPINSFLIYFMLNFLPLSTFIMLLTSPGIISFIYCLYENGPAG
jgi:hypothetical protein